jgi:hypothetical protein
MFKKAMLVLAAIAILAAAPAVFAGEEKADKEGVAITIYNSNLAVVKENRKLDLKAGENLFKFLDVAKMIDATSVHFKSLTDPEGTVVLEQNYEFDLVSASKLMQKYIDKEIAVMTEGGKEYRGTLLSFDDACIVIKDKDGKLSIIQRQENVKDIQFPSLPEGLLTKPTLVWKLFAKLAGAHMAKVTYMTGGISWKADYTVVTNAEDTMLDISGWVTINNYCGATFKDAMIKLIAGDVNRAVDQYAPSPARYGRGGYAEKSADTGFVEKAFAEYHMYTLGRPSTISDNQIKQIELLNATGAKVTKIYRYHGATVPWYGYANYDRNFGMQCNKKVNVYLEFENKKENNMGMPLPGGKIRVYKKDEADGSLEFIGEDEIDHTPKDEKVKILIGNAFDIVGERKSTDFRRFGERSMEETFEIKIRNRKDKDTIKVEVEEVLYRWSNWEIRAKSDNYERKDAQTIIFPVTVEPGQEKVITYTVLYTW